MVEPTGISSRWKLQSEEYPAVSAATAKAARFCGVAHAPDTGAPNPISILLSLTAIRSGGDSERHRSVIRRYIVAADPRTWIATLRESHDNLDSIVRPLTPAGVRGQSYDTEWSIAQ